MAKLQILEKQNKDLRVRVENANAKVKIEREENELKLNELIRQNKEKDGIILMLQKEIQTIEGSIESRIKEAVSKAVAEAVEPLKAELSKANMEIQRQRAIINKDSSNSSKPSSTNGFKAVPNSREASDKRQGGQKGHPGHRLELPRNMEELEAEGILERRVERHAECLINSGMPYISRYTIDVETKIIITEHRYAKNSDIPPEHYNEVSYGSNIKAQVVLLSNEGVIANKRLSGILSSLTRGKVNISTGTIDKILNDFSEGLVEAGELKAIEEDLLNGEVMNTDDTPMRTLERIVYPEEENAVPTYEKAENKSFRATVRTHSNEQSTLYTVNPRKDKAGVERDGILPQYVGNLCHDHESKFYNYGSNNGTCGAHLLRDLKGLKELNCIEWAESMRTFVSSLNDYKNQDLAQGLFFCDPEKLSFFECEYDRIVEEGRIAIAHMSQREFGYSEFNAMLNRLSKHKDNYLLFMRNYKVPFTNNLAERDLRNEKTKEKISGLFRSWDGIVNHTNTRSFFSTVKKRGMDLFSSVKKVFEGQPVLTT